MNDVTGVDAFSVEVMSLLLHPLLLPKLDDVRWRQQSFVATDVELKFSAEGRQAIEDWHVTRRVIAFRKVV